MNEYKIQGETLTTLADEIRELSGTTESKSIDTMISDIDSANAEISNQAELISELMDRINNLPEAGNETWTFTMEDGSTVTKVVRVNV